LPQGEHRHKHHEKTMPSRDQIWNEITRQETQPSYQTQVGVIEQALQELSDEEDPTAAVDILEYIQATWGLGEKPYPIQKAVLKLIFGLTLDSETRDIEIWDQFRENLVAKFTETEFLEYIYKDGRCNISLEEHQKRAGKRHTTVIFRLGRRGTKTTMSQWITAYEIYRLLKLRCPQQYYKLRQDQPIRTVLVATGKEQAQDLLAPARAAIQRSPYLRRYVEHDSAQSIKLATARTRETGVGATSGLSVQASPCSARGLRGPANILALLEEYGSFFWELKGSNKSDVSIYRALQPSISDFKDPITGDPVGMMLIISTPLSKESHMYKLEENIKQGIMNGLVLHIPSWFMNPLLATERLKELHASDRLGFDQEYGAEYLDQVESAFSEEEMRAILHPIDANARRVIPGELTYMGIDLGLKNDGTTISIVAVNAEGKSRLVHHEQWRTKLGKYADYDRIPIEEMAERVDMLWEYWSCKGGIYDQWNCSLPHMRVLLESGIYKRIDELVVGDRVLTHRGRFRPVTSIRATEVSGDIVEIQVEGSPGKLEFTHVHQFQVLNKETRAWQWIGADGIKAGDYLRTVALKEEIAQEDITDELCELVGWYLAEGYRDRAKEHHTGLIGLTLNSEESENEVKLRLEGLLIRCFPPEENVRTGKLMKPHMSQQRNGCKDLRYTNKAAYEFFGQEVKQDQCEEFRRKPAALKWLQNRWLSLPHRQQRILINAFWAGDGYTNSVRNGTKVTGLASWRLIDQLQLICHRLGGSTWQRHTYGTKAIDPTKARSGELKSTRLQQLQHWLGMGKVAASRIFEGIFPVISGKGVGRTRAFYHEDGSFCRRVRSVQKVWYKGPVYDIHVEEDHSYIANGIVAHNAFGLESHLKSGARRALVHVEFNQTGNDRLARHMISVIQQQYLTLYGEATDWDDPDSIVREFVRLQRQQTSGDPPKIKIQAPNIQGFHDDQYSSISRAVWSGKLGVKGHPQTEESGRGRHQRQRAHARRVQIETIRKQSRRTERNPRAGR